MRSRSRSFSMFVLPASLAEVPRPRTLPANPSPSPDQPLDQARTARELWLVLHLPHFMLDALGDSIARLRKTPVPLKNPSNRSTDQSTRKSSAASCRVETPAKSQGLVVVDLERGGKVVCACDGTAAAAGIAPGMALNSALALLPGLQTLARDLQRGLRVQWRLPA